MTRRVDAATPSALLKERVAQLVEHLTFNQEVMGSNPIALTNEIKDLDERLNVKGEPETSSGQRSGQHSADFVAGRPAPCPALTPVTGIVSPYDAPGFESLARRFESCGLPGEILPARHGDVDISRAQLDRMAGATGHLRT